MKYLLFIIACVFAYWLYEDISDVPFSELTLKMVGNNIFAVVIAFGGVKLLTDGD
jgi:hypothetical protein